MDTSSSVIDETFKSIDSKLFILNGNTLDWIKILIMSHITEAYIRGRESKFNY